MKRPFAVLAAAAAALALSACAYFNALYNARRAFADAERAAARGESSAAKTGYNTAIQKAAASYRRDSMGRWSDDALELVGRSYFALDDNVRARMAFERILQRGARGDRRATAQAYLGATMFRAGLAGEALPRLDSAAASVPPGRQLGAFVRLWRARARFAADDASGAWSDLASVGGASGPLGVEARLEAIARAVAAHDSARAAAGFAALLERADGAAKVDSVRTLAREAVSAWSPGVARALLPALASAWPAPARAQLELFRASLAAQQGDTALAIAEASAVARGGGGDAARNRARVAAAQWRLGTARDLTAAAAARADLLGAVTDPDAQRLIRNLKILDVLVDRGTHAEPLALFAGAELARDELAAPALARRLFIAYADLVPRATWAPKALMAAAVLAPPSTRDSIRKRLAAYSTSVYVRERSGAAADSAFSDAEIRLARGLRGTRVFAANEALRRDAGVTHVIAVLDSVRGAARTDSLRLSCGVFADSAGVTGTRGDSLRAACVRGDTARVAFLLKADTMYRADTTATRIGAPGRRDIRGIQRDTVR